MHPSHDYNQLVQDLQKATQGEYEAIEFYKALSRLAPPDHIRYIEQIGRDERSEHIVNFTKYYRQLTHREPVLRPVTTLPTDYVAGVKKAIDDEQEAADFYQKVYLRSRDPYVRGLFFEAMTDEMRHATRLAFLYSNYFLEQGKI
ncbi:ferritin-like domain-containing protein [Brevibacillus sp. LEMMJ03]|uniref:ferritin-like domain-containing protein n=1 Tax=Brevibacillus sp. LEMMJ03 TaxID=2595056 RepID=UPI00163D5175|nr:ferritin-like domain-containing protein [Brevibacillus sp. LEMMJ03]